METFRINDKDSMFEKSEFSFVLAPSQTKEKGTDYRWECRVFFYWEKVVLPPVCPSASEKDSASPSSVSLCLSSSRCNRILDHTSVSYSTHRNVIRTYERKSPQSSTVITELIWFVFVPQVGVTLTKIKNWTRRSWRCFKKNKNKKREYSKENCLFTYRQSGSVSDVLLLPDGTKISL